MNWTLALQIIVWLLGYVEREMLKEAELKQSGKLDEIQASIHILKTSRDPEERKNAALRLHQARKS